MNLKFHLSFLLFLFFFQITQAQDQSISTDELFTRARSAAFDQKDYATAISLSKQALSKSPGNAEVAVFLGRVYTWTKHTDSARQTLHMVLKQEPDNADASLALGSLEFWEDNSEKALEYVNSGLKYHPDATDLLLLKSKILNDLKRWPEANVEIEKVIKADPKSTEARSLSARIRESASKNRVGVTYDFISFDKQFDDPWHLVSADYSRQTKLGSIVGRVNYANRFKTNGIQFEVDAYPRISNTFQAYVSYGYSDNVGVFPSHRAGFSLYANLPASFEAEAGFRYLTFGEATWIYTASVGKYYKSFWFNLRTFVTPSNNNVSQSFALTSRYYYGGADDYLSLRLGTGLSPDDPQNSVLIGDSGYRLRSNNVTLGYRRAIKSLNILMVSVGLDNQEYRANTKGTQFNLGLGYTRRF